MFSYFSGFLKAYTVANDQVIASFLLVQQIGKKHPYLATDVDREFADLLGQVDDLEELFLALDNNELRKDFLAHVREEVADWPAVYSRFFYLQPSRLLVDALINNKEFDSLERIVARVFESYRDLREPFVWLLRNCEDEAWFTSVAARQEKCLTALIHLLDLTYRDIENRRDVSAGRRLNKQIHDYLFKDGNLLRFTLLADLDTITRVHSMVADIEHLDPSIKIRLKEKITDRFPEFESVGEPLAVERTARRPVGHARRLRNQAARASPPDRDGDPAQLQGDRPGDAEGRPARERRVQGRAREAGAAEELRVTAPGRAAGGTDLRLRSGRRSRRCHFGTTVRLTNVATGDNEHFTILGPWESDPARNVISYLSPLGGRAVESSPRRCAAVHDQREAVSLSGGQHRAGRGSALVVGTPQGELPDEWQADEPVQHDRDQRGRRNHAHEQRHVLHAGGSLSWIGQPGGGDPHEGACRRHTGRHLQSTSCQNSPRHDSGRQRQQQRPGRERRGVGKGEPGHSQRRLLPPQRQGHVDDGDHDGGPKSPAGSVQRIAETLEKG